jgi:hypothetical protein
LKQKSENRKIAPLRHIRELIDRNRYRVKAHAIVRQIQRSVSLRDVIFILKHGFHEEEKDQFDIKRQSWRYAIRGKTPDGIDIRVVVAIEKMVIVITVIKPGR